MDKLKRLVDFQANLFPMNLSFIWISIHLSVALSIYLKLFIFDSDHLYNRPLTVFSLIISSIYLSIYLKLFIFNSDHLYNRPLTVFSLIISSLYLSEILFSLDEEHLCNRPRTVFRWDISLSIYPFSLSILSIRLSPLSRFPYP